MGRFGWSSWEHDGLAVPRDGGKIGQKFHSSTQSLDGKIQIPALFAFNAGICCLKASALKKTILGSFQEYTLLVSADRLRLSSNWSVG
jgi:hypothetical protein